MSPISLTPASAQDAEAIARLQAQSWRITYRGMLPDEYLDRHVVADRLAYACCWMKNPCGARGWTTCT